MKGVMGTFAPAHTMVHGYLHRICQWELLRCCGTLNSLFSQPVATESQHKSRRHVGQCYKLLKNRHAWSFSWQAKWCLEWKEEKKLEWLGDVHTAKKLMAMAIKQKNAGLKHGKHFIASYMSVLLAQLVGWHVAAVKNTSISVCHWLMGLRR